MTDAIVGMDLLLAKQSAVDAQGRLRDTLISGVELRPSRPVPHGDGYMSEVARANWDIIKSPIVQVHVTTTLPGRVRAASGGAVLAVLVLLQLSAFGLVMARFYA